MISVEEAKQLINKNVKPMATTELLVVDALNHVIAETIISPINVPSFNQSAMDGYAFNFSDKEQPITITDEVAAGDIDVKQAKKNTAIRIFTGAKVPDFLDTVVMQELVEVVNNQLIVKDKGLKLGGNIRKLGSQIKKGEIALEKDTKITPAAVGFLSALGITKVQVYKFPKITVIATGNELVKPGRELKDGQVYESNTFMLQAALKSINISANIEVVRDDAEKTQETIKNAIQQNDVVILTGGISVGDYDFVKGALANLGVQDIFYKVKQKPGKPIYFGKTASTLIFGLPGNPAAALSCFYQYVYQAIHLMIGNVNNSLYEMEMPLANSLNKKSGRSVFYKAFTDFKSVSILEGQGSDVLKSFAVANCLVYVAEEVECVEKNERVNIFLLPQC